MPVGNNKLITLSTVALPEAEQGAPLPTEFVLFKAGVNESSKGPALFDESAAAAVMAAYGKWGVDLMIDVDHASLDQYAREQRRDAGDAVGWFNLEVRDGALWAVNVRWNPEGERQLRDKLRRYISPAFYTDDYSRVTELINIALVAMPATFGAQPLVAASRGAIRRLSMDPKQIAAAIDAIKNADSEAALAILEAMLISAAGGEQQPEPPKDPSAEAPMSEAAPALETKLSALLGVAGADAIEAAVAALKASADEASEVRAAQLSAVRRGLIATLVQLGAETPATAWEDTAKQVPVKRLADESVESLRSRVVALRARGNGAPPAPPKADAPDLTALEQRELSKMTPAQQASFIALRAQRKAK